jgi:hypothetical protein
MCENSLTGESSVIVKTVLGENSLGHEIVKTV